MRAQALTDLSAASFLNPSEGMIALQQCDACRSLQWPADFACRECQNPDWHRHWIRPRGAIYSVTRIHHPLPAGEAPYLVALVNLTEGPRIAARLQAAEMPMIGAQVEAVDAPGASAIHMRLCNPLGAADSDYAGDTSGKESLL